MTKPFTLSKKQEYVGLSNQGATCYMNSLLQTLYMTPEFRREIYRWKYEEKLGNRETCIPLQLQILFVRLQTSQSYCIETTALTKSFGWTQAESFQQHDVQEFCRVLFEAIEKSTKETNSAKFIQDLYEGIYEDYVKCSSCNTESIREDKFLDLSLTIKNQHERIYNDSVEKALTGFVRPEYLTEANQYFCETCKSKKDAQKGLKFKKLPCILVLQLKRFDYDYHTNKRIKINDKVSFEEIMNLNYLLNNSPTMTQMDLDESPKEMIPFFEVNLSRCNFQYKEFSKKEYLQTPSGKQNLPMDMHAKKKYKEKKFLKKQEERTQKIEEYLKQGPYVYELYSIMIHSGSAWGGHYYAYIKSFESGKWFSFNDANVAEISYKDVNKVFGGPSNFGSSTSAYLLMYRQIDREKNLMTVPDSEISDEIKVILQKIQQKAEEENQRRLDELKKITVNIRFKNEIKDVVVRNDELVLALKKVALAAFSLDVNEENARLRDIEISGRHGKVLFEQGVLNKVSIGHNKKVLLEIKAPNEDFEDYDPSKITVKYIEWRESFVGTLEELMENGKKLKISNMSTSEIVMDSIANTLNVLNTEILVFKKHPYNMFLERINSNKNKGTNFYQSSVPEGAFFFVEKLHIGPGKSNWETYFEQESAKVTIRIILNSEIPFSQDKKVVIHPQRPLLDLVQAISGKLQIPADSIILKKRDSNSELKDMNQIIKLALPYNEVIVLKGAPLKVSQVRLGVFLAGINTKPLKDNEFFKFFHLFDLPIDLESSFKDLKSLILQETSKFFPSMNLPIIRIREVQSDRLGKWLDDSMKIRDIIKDDGKKVAVQPISTEDPLREKDDIILTVRKLNTANWELETQRDIIISGKSSCHTFAEKLAQIYSMNV